MKPEGAGRLHGAAPLTIAYFGNDWFTENRTSSHHVARRLAQRRPLIYFESPGLRAPRASGRDARKILQKVARFLRGPRLMADGIVVQTLLQLPWHRHAFVRRVNEHLLWLTVRLVLWLKNVKRPVSWFLVPHVASLAGRLGERLVVYYCTDDHASLPGVDAPTIVRMDEALTRKADLVFVVSATLMESKRALNPHTYLSPHGVDFAHFVRAQDAALRPPADVAELRHPLVGFFGLIERWIDLDLVAYLADRRPDWTFLMIGRLAMPPAETPRRPNIIFVGTRPYETLPAYGKAFDAAIIPYRLTKQVLAANPLKLREYLAMGKPIVSVSTPEVDHFAEFVSIARSREEFLEKLDRAISQGLSPEQVERQTQFASTMTWDAPSNEYSPASTRDSRMRDADAGLPFQLYSR